MHSISMPTQDHLIEATTLHCTAQRRTRKSSPPLMPLPPRRTRSTRPAVHLPAPCIATRVPRPGNAPRRHRGTRAKLWSRWPPLNPRSRISITSPRRRRTVNHARTHARADRTSRPAGWQRVITDVTVPVTSPAGDERTDRSMPDASVRLGSRYDRASDAVDSCRAACLLSDQFTSHTPLGHSEKHAPCTGRGQAKTTGKPDDHT